MTFRDKQDAHWSEFRAVPIIDRRPTHHDNDMTLPNGMLIAGLLRDVPINRLAHGMLEAHWRDDADLANRETLAELGTQAGLDPEPLLDAALSPETRAVYEANTEEAIRRSVFGSPTYFVDGDMFYGQDRLELVERALVKPFAGCWQPPVSYPGLSLKTRRGLVWTLIEADSPGRRHGARPRLPARPRGGAVLRRTPPHRIGPPRRSRRSCLDGDRRTASLETGIFGWPPRRHRRRYRARYRVRHLYRKRCPSIRATPQSQAQSP